MERNHRPCCGSDAAGWTQHGSATKVKHLGVGQRQLIGMQGIIKDVQLLILNEPTAALNDDDSENLQPVAGPKAGRDFHHDLPQTERSARHRGYDYRARDSGDQVYGCPSEDHRVGHHPVYGWAGDENIYQRKSSPSRKLCLNCGIGVL